VLLLLSVRIRLADFAADYDDLHRIRFAVFVDEQCVPPELELDDRDPLCLHVLAFDAAQAVATGRLDVAYDGKIGRVAVLPSHRRTGVGTLVMDRLHALAREHGLARVWCNAQLTAAPFYERLGYRVAGAPFEEAGIAHVRMTFELPG
jgi:predicted GNAT family N-acyltransferase